MILRIRHRLIEAPANRKRRRPTTDRVVPRLECLEDRTAPAGLTVTVTTLNDTPAVNPNVSALDGNGNVSLRSAIQYINAQQTSSNTIQFQNLTGTISLATALDPLQFSTTIIGSGMNNLFVTRSNAMGTGNFRIFTVQAQCTISGLNIVNGALEGDDGAGIYNSGILTLNNVDIDHNTTDQNGGGVYNASGATLSLNTCQIWENFAGTDGGGIANSGTLYVLSSTIISVNTGNQDGGGIFNGTGAGATVEGNIQISGNASLNGGGIASVGVITMNGVSVTSNAATVNGGGLYYEDGQAAAQLQNVTFSQNTARDGGGFYLDGFMTLSGCTVSGNKAADQGPGGYLVVGSAVQATNCTITDQVDTGPP